MEIKENIIKLRAKKSELAEELRMLYAVFNKASAVEMSEIDINRLEEIDIRMKVLDDRRILIIREGYGKVCPCCGTTLEDGFINITENEIKALEEERQTIVDKNQTKTEKSNEELNHAIAALEKQQFEIDELIKELKDYE